MTTTSHTSTSAPPQRLQRTVEVLPIVHLESEPPDEPGWPLEIGGLVGRPGSFSIEDLRALGDRFMIADHHCVWGWTRPTCRWRGLMLGALLDHVGVLPGASTVTVRCRASDYATCLHLADARHGMLAWGLDGGPLAPGNGGPLRFQNPEWLWGYKGVKWVGRIEVGDRFVPGFWEELVGDPEGRVPRPLIEQFGYWRRRNW